MTLDTMCLRSILFPGICFLGLISLLIRLGFSDMILGRKYFLIGIVMWADKITQKTASSVKQIRQAVMAEQKLKFVWFNGKIAGEFARRFKNRWEENTYGLSKRKFPGHRQLVWGRLGMGTAHLAWNVWECLKRRFLLRMKRLTLFFIRFPIATWKR